MRIRGASSSLMQEIANGTFNYSTLSEIMPMIYKRFTEKSAEEWRQIYKALQLLEFLIKNGSERVVDDARSHMSLLKMLRQFHYIDQNGKDQGINVRNRSKELTELLGDVDRIRTERKKARATRNKYGGSEGGMGLGGSMSTGRYGGFGSETGGGMNAGYGGYSGGVYGDGGGFGGQQSSEEYSSTQGRRDRFEEYDEYDEGGTTSPAPRRNPPNRTTPVAPPKSEPAKPKAPEVDLFDFGDDDIGGTTAPAIQPPSSNGKAPATQSVLDDFGTMQSSGGGDDEFDDFQAATPAAPASSNILSPSMPAMNNPVVSAPSTSAATPLVSPPPSSAASVRAASTANYSAFYAPAAPTATTATPPVASPPMQPTNRAQTSSYQPQGPNYFGSISTATMGSGSSTPSVNNSTMTPNAANAGTMKVPSAGQAKKASAGDPFASLGLGGLKKTATQKGPTMADMAKQKTDAALWGSSTGSQQQRTGGNTGGDLI